MTTVMAKHQEWLLRPKGNVDTSSSVQLIVLLKVHCGIGKSWSYSWPVLAEKKIMFGSRDNAVKMTEELSKHTFN